jgi:glycosyltransferase involved in cell wall biosynthesis
MNPASNSPLRRWRILMYTSYFAPEFSGAGLQALTLGKELRKRGHQVEFITNQWTGLSATTVVDGFPVRRLEPGRGEKHREFRLWFNMARYLWTRRRDFDFLHSHGAYFTNAFVGPLASSLGMGSLVKASLADDDLHGLGRGFVGRWHRAMLGAVGAYVAISRDLAGEFAAGGFAEKKIHFVPNGVDTERFHPADAALRTARRLELQLPPDKPIALYVGVFDQRKNVRWLAEQWVAHSGFGTGALLLAVGPQARDDAGGQLRARLVELAALHPDLLALRDYQADPTRGLPVRRYPGPAFHQGGPAQCRARGNGMRAALRGIQEQWQPRACDRRIEWQHFRARRGGRTGYGHPALFGP